MASVMEFNMEWNIICRVCLQEGEMRSIFEKDDKNISICDKIIKCTNLNIQRGMNLPEQICNKCLDDLNIAYKFRINCESSDAILQSFVEGNVVNVNDLIVASETGEIYKYRPPQGLNVKRIKASGIKTDPYTTRKCTDNSNVTQSNSEVSFSNISEQYIEETEDVKTIDVDENTVSPFHDNPDDPPRYENTTIKEDLAEAEYEISESGRVCTIKPVKTNKARSKAAAGKEKLRVVSAQEISTKSDGTTVIRVRRNFGEPKPLKICEICGNTYKYKHALESHMRRHRNEKPFSCEICGRSFVINFELRRHMRTHTGQKPYACQFCGRRFSDFGSRIKHERTHTGERPYTCETCGKSFAYSHVLSSHILTHTGEKRYLCMECGKRFAKSHHLKAHMNTHYKNQNKPVDIKPTVVTPQYVTNMNTPEKQVIYHADEGVYEEVINVLTAQPKIEQCVDEEDIKVVYTTDVNYDC